VVGFVVDHSSAAWGFAVAGIGGVLVAGIATALGRRTRRPGGQRVSASAIS
jgi:hypothetical protein